jgi:hypothetical protein
MDRYIRDGEVAILYSPGYGAGWSTWNTDYPCEELLFDPGLVSLILEWPGLYDDPELMEKIEVYTTLKWPKIYVGGLVQLTVGWLPVGTKFYIDETDGAEAIVTEADINWLTA